MNIIALKTLNLLHIKSIDLVSLRSIPLEFILDLIVTESASEKLLTFIALESTTSLVMLASQLLLLLQGIVSSLILFVCR